MTTHTGVILEFRTPDAGARPDEFLKAVLVRAAKALDIAADAAAVGHEAARLGRLPLHHQAINGAATLAAARGLLALLDAEGAPNHALPLRRALCAYIEERLS